MDRETTDDLPSGMTAVPDSSLRQLMDLIEAGRTGPVPTAGLPEEVVDRALALVSCDVVAFNEFDSRARTHLVGQTARRSETGDLEDDDAAFWHHYDACLPCSYPERSGDLRTVTTASDFYTVRDWHATGMYADYFRPLGVEHEAMVCLSAPRGLSRRLLFFRGPGPDFSEGERLLLALLRPHLDELSRSLDQRRDPAVQLTDRQWELLVLVARGHSNSEIARLLFLSAGTVRKHLENIFERLDVSSRTAAVAVAFPAGSQETAIRAGART
jgi:DNA-binding CsgD family transcriptional regulator